MLSQINWLGASIKTDYYLALEVIMVDFIWPLDIL